MDEADAADMPRTAALFALVQKFTANKVFDALKGEDGTVLEISLDHTTEAVLRSALSAGAQVAVAAVASQVEHTDVDPDVGLSQSVRPLQTTGRNGGSSQPWCFRSSLHCRRLPTAVWREHRWDASLACRVMEAPDVFS